MLKLGEKIISDIYLGDKKIAKVFLGDKLVYQAGKPIFLDYVIFDGNSWIDTGLYGSNNTKIEATYQPTAFENGFYGSYSSGKNFTAYISKSGAWRFGNGAVYHTHTSSIVCDSIQNKDGATVNGKTLAYSAQSDFVTASTLTVGKVNGSTFTNFKGNIYSFKFYESDVLIQDLRPCIDPNGTVCMYDMVTKKYFYNKGTGTLTAGNKIKFVDYVEFDGASWIDTGLIAKNGLSVKLDHQLTKLGTTQQLFGGRSATDKRFGVASAIGNNLPYYDLCVLTDNYGKYLVCDLLRHTLEFNSDNSGASLSIDGDVIATTTNVNNQEINLFLGANNYTNKIPAYMRAYSCEMYENGVLVRDFKPCVVAGEAGLYDMVTGKVFTNAGTGTLKASGRFVTSILFDGASWIDTGIYQQTCTVECDIRFENTGTRQLMGFGSANAQYWGSTADNLWSTGIATVPSSYAIATQRNIATIDYNTNNETAPTSIITVNGYSSKVVTGTAVYEHTYKIGGLRNSFLATCEVWGNKFTVNGEVIQDLRPYVDENNVACFKDVVTGNLFYNQGTGTLGYTEE